MLRLYYALYCLHPLDQGDRTVVGLVPTATMATPPKICGTRHACAVSLGIHVLQTNRDRPVRTTALKAADKSPSSATPVPLTNAHKHHKKATASKGMPHESRL